MRTARARIDSPSSSFCEHGRDTRSLTELFARLISLQDAFCFAIFCRIVKCKVTKKHTQEDASLSFNYSQYAMVRTK